MSNPILVTGAEGMLGSAVVREGVRQALYIIGLSRRDCDITDTARVKEVLDYYPKALVINCAGIVRERSDLSDTRMAEVNSLGPHILACYSGRVLQVSTDCVFDGRLERGAYWETDVPHPRDPYGAMKLQGELAYPPHLTVRGSFIGLGQHGLLHWLLSHPEGAEVQGYRNWMWNGWTAAALAPVLLNLAVERELTGLVHLPGPRKVVKGWLLEELARRLRPDLQVIQHLAPEPRWMVLGSKLSVDHTPVPSWPQMFAELEAEYRKLHAPAGFKL